MDMKFLGSTEGKTRRDIIRNEIFREDTGFQNLIEVQQQQIMITMV
jgi:hypothetical protein